MKSLVETNARLPWTDFFAPNHWNAQSSVKWAPAYNEQSNLNNFARYNWGPVWLKNSFSVRKKQNKKKTKKTTGTNFHSYIDLQYR